MITAPRPPRQRLAPAPGRAGEMAFERLYPFPVHLLMDPVFADCAGMRKINTD